MYYSIDERAAKTAHTMNSMFEYQPNRTTNAYQAEVNEAAEIALHEIEKRPEQADEINALLDRYARKLAEWYNKQSRIESMCVSMLVSGGGNFPTNRKNKQNAARDRHMKEWEEIDGIKRKMRSIGTGGIQSDDAKAVEKLQTKLEGLENCQQTMKAANAYYKQHKTLDGFPGMAFDTIQEIKASMSRSWRKQPRPFEEYELSNNNANIHRVRVRIAQLEKAKAQDTTERETTVEGVKLVEDTELMRIQLVFDGKPAPEVRDILKAHGFRWAPSQSAWQRQLNGNGKYAARQVLEKLATV